MNCRAEFSSLFDLSGKVALVTGATGWLGSAIARAMTAHGAAVAVSDVDADACAAFAAELSTGGAPAAGLAADLSRREGAERLARAALDRFGAVDVLVWNAGVQGPAGPTGDVTDAD